MAKLGPMYVTKNTGTKHTATLIFFHGSGGNGADMKEWVRLMVKNFSFPHIKVLYPTAPAQPYTPSYGTPCNVWFDRAEISIKAPEMLESIANIEGEVRNLIKKENEEGILTNRIIVGGFSMGGALAFHSGYRWERGLAGVFAFSSFLNDKSIMYEELQNAKGETLPPLLQIHGDSDELVHLKWGETTFNELQSVGVPGEFYVMKRLGHSLNRRGIDLIKAWAEKLLPDTNNIK